jgi:oxygen-independent coproporphyrinogen-3 oxidase
MLKALRLTEGFEHARYTERTGLSIATIQQGLEQAEREGLLARDLSRAWPTARGLDFLSDLQGTFLP